MSCESRVIQKGVFNKLRTAPVRKRLIELEACTDASLRAWFGGKSLLIVNYFVLLTVEIFASWQNFSQCFHCGSNGTCYSV